MKEMRSGESTDAKRSFVTCTLLVLEIWVQRVRWLPSKLRLGLRMRTGLSPSSPIWSWFAKHCVTHLLLLSCPLGNTGYTRTNANWGND